jgi:Putative peptidoglycan binding domain./G5 domain./VanW like protein.
MKRPGKFLVTATLFILALAAFAFPRKAYAEENEDIICNGVYIDTVDVSGMTAKEAQEALKKHIEELRKKSFALVVDDKSIIITMGDLDYSYEPNNYIEQAVNLGKSGNIVKRYKDKKDIEHGKIVFPLTYTYNESKLRKFIDVDARKLEKSAKNASFKRKSGKFVYTDHVTGNRIETEPTIQAIKDKLDNWNRMDFVVHATMTEVEPEITREKLEQCNSVLGEFTTEFTSSSADRAANLANGARLINNAVLYPGDVFSSLSYLLPFSLENGYYMAGSYNAGRVEQTIGGGACQVTTTLYNAVLLSELEIVERHNHSMTVSYVDLAFDAAVSESAGKDFCFRNNTDMPILIEAFSEDRKITFRIWGHETRDTKNRKIKFENKVLKEIAPSSKEKITKDPTKPASYRKVTQQAKKGYYAELYKVVYENGVEVSRELINKSYYNAEPAHVTVGTKKN